MHRHSTMTSIDEKDIASKCPRPSMNNTPSSAASSCAMSEETMPSVRMNAATVYLLRKVASGMPRIANIMWGMFHDFGWDETMVGMIKGMNAQALAQVVLATNAVLYSALSPYFQEPQSINEFGGSSSDNVHTQENELPPILSDISDSSSCEQNMEINEGGLMFQSADFNRDEGTERLDYVITQADVSRMARIASRHLNVESIDQLPTTVYRAKDQLVCSSHEDENVDEFLLRNAQIIEDYFDNTEDNVEHECLKQDPKREPSQFSWMLVPKDPKEDDMTRMSDCTRTGEVPDSISICKSTASLKVECDGHDDDAFEHCVICEEPFADGECLRVLPCQHLFHCGCIDKWPSEEDASRDQSIIFGCPTCKKKSLEPAQQEVSDDASVHEHQGESCQSDGTVPSWAFARLGSLLSGLNHESTPSE